MGQLGLRENKSWNKLGEVGQITASEHFPHFLLIAYIAGCGVWGVAFTSASIDAGRLVLTYKLNEEHAAGVFA